MPQGTLHVVAELVLGPCKRTGDPAEDWWQEQHLHCRGVDVLAPGKAVRCTCPCHTDPTSTEGLERAAAEALAAGEGGAAMQGAAG